MPRFITFFSYAGAADKAMIERPSDRSAASKALVEALGGTQEAFYWMQGKHDGFVIPLYEDMQRQNWWWRNFRGLMLVKERLLGK